MVGMIEKKWGVFRTYTPHLEMVYTKLHNNLGNAKIGILFVSLQF